jgi:hypothetical protein
VVAHAFDEMHEFGANRGRQIMQLLSDLGGGGDDFGFFVVGFDGFEFTGAFAVALVPDRLSFVQHEGAFVGRQGVEVVGDVSGFGSETPAPTPKTPISNTTVSQQKKDLIAAQAMINKVLSQMK